ncbi:MAG: helix-turn-helix domain-containing protein [Polyangiaceae bacterium]|nr:helix-turn-helix domain-containing protein [Polyangiaceae bacterium]
MTPAERLEIHRLAAEGASARAIARQLGVSHPTIAVELRRPAPVEAAPVEAEPPTDVDSLGCAQELLRDVQSARRAALAEGDAAIAGRLARTEAMALAVLARVESHQQCERDGFWTSYADLERGRAAYRERVVRLTAQPLTCSRCGARLRAEVAGVPAEHLDAIERGGA